MVGIFWNFLGLACLISTIFAQGVDNGNFVKIRDECLVESSLTLEELSKPMPTIDDTPEGAWCLVKCMGTKLEIIGEDGTVDVEKLRNNQYVKLFIPRIQTQLVTCTKEAGKIENCDDMKKIKECLKKLISA